MKQQLKRILSGTLLATLAVGVMGSSVLQAAAENIGYIDLEKIYSNYDKAASIRADIKVKEAELRKLQADYVKQLEESRKDNPKNPVGNDMLEKELNEKLNAKINEYRSWVATQQKSVDESIRSAIQNIVSSRKIDVVLTRPAVYVGGTDLTNDVLTKINQ